MSRFLLVATFFSAISIAPTYALSEHHELRKDNPQYYHEWAAYKVISKLL